MLRHLVELLPSEDVFWIIRVCVEALQIAPCLLLAAFGENCLRLASQACNRTSNRGLRLTPSRTFRELYAAYEKDEDWYKLNGEWKAPLEAGFGVVIAAESDEASKSIPRC